MDLAALLAGFDKLPASQHAKAREYILSSVAAPESAPDDKFTTFPSSYARCFEHKHLFIGVCVECGVPVCTACQACIVNHTIRPFDDVIADAFPSPPSKKKLHEIAAVARSHVPSSHASATNALQVERETERKANAHASFVKEAASIRKKDTDELMRMRDELTTAQGRVDTDAAKAALVDACERLSVDALIDAELTRHRKSLAETNVALARARASASKLQGELERLEFVSALKNYPDDISARCVLALVAQLPFADASAAPGVTAELAVADAAGTPYAFPSGEEMFGWACSVRDFRAFDGVCDMTEVIGALEAQLHNNGPVRVGGVQAVPWLPAWRKGGLSASLSACGELCIGGSTDSLVVVHLPTQRVATVTCGGPYVHAFVHARELYVALRGQAVLHHTPVAEVLAGRTDLAEFEQMPLAAMWGKSARLDSAPAGWVAASNYGNAAQHMVVDLAARTSRLVDVGKKLPHLGGFTGIDVPGAAWAASTGSNSAINTVFAVAPDGSKKAIVNRMFPGPTVLPSTSEPANLSRAAVLDWDAHYSLGGAKGSLVRPIKPWRQSLVRLYRDVFLCWDHGRKAWLVTRIVVA